MLYTGEMAPPRLTSALLVFEPSQGLTIEPTNEQIFAALEEVRNPESIPTAYILLLGTQLCRLTAPQEGL